MATCCGFPVDPGRHSACLTTGVTHLNTELGPLAVREVDDLLQWPDVAVILKIKSN